MNTTADYHDGPRCRASEEAEPRYPGRRVENLGANVSAWCTRTGSGSSSADLCAAHAAQLDKNPHCFDAVLAPSGDGEPLGDDGWGGDVEHPPYDGESLRCAICGDLLGGG